MRACFVVLFVCVLVDCNRCKILRSTKKRCKKFSKNKNFKNKQHMTNNEPMRRRRRLAKHNNEWSLIAQIKSATWGYTANQIRTGYNTHINKKIVSVDNMEDDFDDVDESQSISERALQKVNNREAYNKQQMTNMEEEYMQVKAKKRICHSKCFLLKCD